MSYCENLLASVLDCGSADIRLLEDCEYAYEDLISEVESMGYEKPDINNLVYAMFHLAKGDLQGWIENKITELEEEREDDLTEERLEELDEAISDLKSLDPYEDLESFHNYLDTHIYVRSSISDVYRKYCEDGLDLFYEKTGFYPTI